MEDRLWGIVCRVVPVCKPNGRQLYSNREILMVVLWAVLHDRPMAWACQPENWPGRRRPQRLPHASTVSRRSRTKGFAEFVETVHEEFRSTLGSPSKTAAIDGKPLLISDYSRDPDARNGRAYRQFGRGYKLHAVIDQRGVVLAFEVLSLNVNERVPASRMLPHLPPAVRRILADGNYDSGPLHKQLECTNCRLYAPPQNGYASPKSHRRRHELVRLMAHPIAIRLANEREHIERQFALMGNVGCGLKGLPNWVRRSHRVTRWISCKLLLHHTYLIERNVTA